jgi:hypothetical protein
MPSEVITIGPNFAVTLGLAAFVGIPGRGDDHGHWTHQIAVDLEDRHVECFCDGQWLKGTGVFVPAGHSHSVQPGKQINLFFDTCVDWLAEMFGGELDTSCGRVLDRDTLQGVQSCFYEGAELAESMSVFASAFELRTHVRMDALAFKDWNEILDKARDLKHNQALTLEEKYKQLASLFS